MVTASEESTSATQPNPTVQKQTETPSTGNRATNGMVGRPPKRSPVDTSPAVHPPLKKRKTKSLAKSFSKPPEQAKSPVVSHERSDGNEEIVERVGEGSVAAVQKVENDREIFMHNVELDGDHSVLYTEGQTQYVGDAFQASCVCATKEPGVTTKTIVATKPVTNTPSDDRFVDTAEPPAFADKIEPRQSDCLSSSIPASSVCTFKYPSTLTRYRQARSGSHDGTGVTTCNTRSSLTLVQQDFVSVIAIMRLDKEDLVRAGLNKHEAFLQTLMLSNDSMGLIVQKVDGHGGERSGSKRGLIRCGAEVFAGAGRSFCGIVARLCDIFGSK